MKFGLRAEGWTIELLRRYGIDARKATYKEDIAFKVDLWIPINGYWIPIQLSVDKEAIMSWKGKEALKLGIVPMWIDGQELEIAIISGNGVRIVKEFLIRVEKILATFPTLKRFSEPHWNYALQIN